MSKEQEIRELANKLLQSGVSRSHMDALKMAESMIGTDLTPSGRKIDNLDAPNVTVPKKPISNDFSSAANPQVSVGANVDTTKTVAEIAKEEETVPEIKSEILEEIKEVEEEPNVLGDDTIRGTVTPETEAEVVEELIEIETSPDAESSIVEERMEQEMEVPEIVKTEQAIDSTETETEVIEEIQNVEEMQGSETVQQQTQMQEEINAPAEIQEEKIEEAEVAKPEVIEEVQEVEKKADYDLSNLQDTKSTGVEEYAAQKLAEQGAMETPALEQVEDEITEVVEEAPEVSAPAPAVPETPAEPSETFILSNTDEPESSQDDEESDTDDITKLF